MVALNKARYFEQLPLNAKIICEKKLSILHQLSDFKYPKISKLNINEQSLLSNIFLENCKDCRKMAAIPQGAFAACKLREQFCERDFVIARIRSGGDRNETKNMGDNRKLMEYNPNKYNDKLMNSIWGFYNRYSPHNIKGNDYELASPKEKEQQPSVVAPLTAAKKLAKAVFSDMDWSFKKN